MVGMLARPAPAVVVALLRVAWVGCDMRLVDKWIGYDDWLTRDLPDDEPELDEEPENETEDD
ncbi:hypothetical protein LL999_23105 [Burkholderia ambifaria]|uniref:hypothetical protein n=1 Tax=Burkholderia ambifaria TaxID=152480 RepID=UPI001E520B19|nr:hypothetical protein [Burkholderia ambifaria]UEP23135.1 hypothetical protein LL999_23105 [Burkholderia ambifaria]